MARLASDDYFTNYGSISGDDVGGANGLQLRVNNIRQILWLPNFYRREPSVWFAEIELLFEYAGIQTKKNGRGGHCSVRFRISHGY